MKKDFRERLKTEILVCDGAMGTLLYTKGIYINRCFEGLNLDSKDLVRQVHREYVRVGADIIETNTYGANRFKLATHGLEGRLEEVNRAGVELARDVASENVLVAGSMGPTGQRMDPSGPVLPADLREAFRRQAAALAAGGVDLFILETFNDLDELELAIEAVRDVSDLPLLTLMTILSTGTTIHGVSAVSIAERLSRRPIDGLGLNCSIGPKETLDFIQQMRKVTDLPLVAQPNAGNPQSVEGRTLYMTTPEYMAEYAGRMIRSGVNVVGGCCGTTPEHIRSMVGAVRMLQPRARQALEATVEEVVTDYEPVPREEKSRLACALADGRFVVSVEIDPPPGTDHSRVMEAAQVLHRKGIDTINIADGPRASARMSPMSLATLFERQIGIETILHYCCRDRNILGMQSDLLGANALGLRNILIITGDPPKMGDYPHATAVFDVDSIGLTGIASRMNRGIDIAGKKVGRPTAFHIGVGANPGAIDLEMEVDRFKRKIDAGAEYVMTQPVYDIQLFEKFMKRVAPCPIPVLVGILPLASHRNAEFLHNEVPGMQIPEEIRARMAKAGSGPDARAEGVRIAQEALLASRPLVQGVYIMPPFNRYEAALEVLEVLQPSGR